MPKRSNRCETCKRRKVKCDETKPFCLRCTRQGLRCEYSDEQSSRRRVAAFRDQTQRTVAKAEASYARETPSNRHPSTTLMRRFAQTETDEHPTKLLSSEERIYNLPPLELMDTSRERRTQLLNTFIYSYLPESKSQIVPSHYAYMYILNDIVGQHPALPSAVDALALYNVGRAYNDDSVISKAKTIYGTALNRLARNLPRTRLYAPTGTMAAIAVLAWCELSLGSPTNPDAFENHMLGAESLLESYEPSMWETSEGLLFIQALRYMLMCTGFIRRKAVIFTQPQWRDLVDGGPEPGMWVKFMNNAAQIPGLLEDADKITVMITADNEPAEQISDLVDELLDRSLDLRVAMLTWWEEFESGARPDAAILRPITELEWWQPTPWDESAFPEIYYFAECKDCYCRLQFWLGMMILDKHLLALYDSGYASLDASNVNYEQQPHREELEEELLTYADDAARCLPTSFDPLTPPVSKFNAALAIKLTGDIFFNFGLTNKYEWIRTMSDRLEAVDFMTPRVMKLSIR